MNEESITVTLTLDNDETLECLVLTIYETNGQKYIALLPLDEEGDNTDGGSSSFTVIWSLKTANLNWTIS